MIFNLIQVDRPDAMSRPRLEPPLIKLSVVNRHNVRDATPGFGSGRDGESTIFGRPSDVVVNESNAVCVREAEVSCCDRIEVIHRESVDEIRIPALNSNLFNPTRSRQSNRKRTSRL